LVSTLSSKQALKPIFDSCSGRFFFIDLTSDWSRANLQNKTGQLAPLVHQLQSLTSQSSFVARSLSIQADAGLADSLANQFQSHSVCSVPSLFQKESRVHDIKSLDVDGKGIIFYNLKLNLDESMALLDSLRAKTTQGTTNSWFLMFSNSMAFQRTIPLHLTGGSAQQIVKIIEASKLSASVSNETLGTSAVPLFLFQQISVLNSMSLTLILILLLLFVVMVFAIGMILAVQIPYQAFTLKRY